MGITEAVSVFVGAFASGVWFWYDKKKSDTEIKEMKAHMRIMNDTLIKHSSVHITEEKSRKISEDVSARIEKDITETKAMVQTMMNQLTNLSSSMQAEKAVQRALEDKRNNR